MAPQLAGSELMVRAVDRAEPRLNGQVFRVRDGRPLPAAADAPACQRAYFAGGRGLCLAVARSGVEYEAIVLGAGLRPRARLGLAGLPSRARVSPDGRYGATTVFVSGHAYAASGEFSTTTTLIDMRRGEAIADLEEFAVVRDGRTVDAPDYNLWGVTFAADSDRFYVTLRTGGEHYLAQGSVSDRTLRVLRGGVECPSLSPDGTRVAFKSRIGDSDTWRLRVLDLATLRDRPVAERRSIDDQAEWLDDETLVYSDGTDVYLTAADGSGKPRLVLADATSPAALRRH